MQARMLTAEQANSIHDPLFEANVLVIPGWNGSGCGHWQTLWEEQYANFRRIQQQNWARPPRSDWVARIDEEVGRSDAHVVLVAHSLGCLAVAHWAAEGGRSHRVDGAFLVAPPWLTDSDASPRELDGFLPMPHSPLPFPSLFVASENDPYLPIEIGRRLASAWGSEFVNVGRQGHINIASGHGPWRHGERLLTQFTGRIHSERQSGQPVRQSTDNDDFLSR